MINDQTKQWKSITEQLQILKERNLVIHNKDRAMRYLKKLGYYRLSGYWYPLRKVSIGNYQDNAISNQRSDFFMQGASFDSVISFMYSTKS